MPHHLIPTDRDQGILTMPTTFTDTGVGVTAAHSTFGRRVWLTIQKADGTEAFAHLDLVQARQIAEQLIHLADTHPVEL